MCLNTLMYPYNDCKKYIRYTYIICTIIIWLKYSLYIEKDLNLKQGNLY